jgi:hypothetical protein
MRIYRSVSGPFLAGAAITVAGVAILLAMLAPWQDKLGLTNTDFIFLLFVLSVAAIWRRSVGIRAQASPLLPAFTGEAIPA